MSLRRPKPPKPSCRSRPTASAHATATQRVHHDPSPSSDAENPAITSLGSTQARNQPTNSTHLICSPTTIDMFNPPASNPWVRRLPTQRSKATESSCGVERAAKKRSKTRCPQSSLCRSRVVGLRELSFGPNRVARASFFRKVERRPRARGHVASPARLSSPTYRRPVNDAALPFLSSVAGAMITRFLYSPVVSWETLASHPAGDGFPSGQDCSWQRCLHSPYFGWRHSTGWAMAGQDESLRRLG